MKLLPQLYILFFLAVPCLFARKRKTILHPTEHSTPSQSHHTPGWSHPTLQPSAPHYHLGTQMGIVETPGIDPLGYTRDGTTKVFTLTAQPVEQMMNAASSKNTLQHDKKLLLALKNILGYHPSFTSQKLKAWGYTGSTPGPTLELTVGDQVRITVKNELPEPTLLHFHGLELPHELDLTTERNPIRPGQTITYEFIAKKEGTFLYHSGYSIQKQSRRGLVGMIVVHPHIYDKPIDKHIALIVQDWAVRPESSQPNTLVTRCNRQTLNGRAAPSIPLIEITQGERVRLHCGSLASTIYPLKLHGPSWILVGTEGGPLTSSAQIPGAQLQLSPGTVRVVEFTADNPGLWPLYALTKPYQTEPSELTALDSKSHGGIFTLVNIVPKDSAAEESTPAAEPFSETSLRRTISS